MMHLQLALNTLDESIDCQPDQLRQTRSPGHPSDAALATTLLKWRSRANGKGRFPQPSCVIGRRQPGRRILSEYAVRLNR